MRLLLGAILASACAAPGPGGPSGSADDDDDVAVDARLGHDARSSVVGPGECGLTNEYTVTSPGGSSTTTRWYHVAVEATADQHAWAVGCDAVGSYAATPSCPDAAESCSGTPLHYYGECSVLVGGLQRDGSRLLACGYETVSQPAEGPATTQGYHYTSVTVYVD